MIISLIKYAKAGKEKHIETDELRQVSHAIKEKLKYYDKKENFVWVDSPDELIGGTGTARIAVALNDTGYAYDKEHPVTVNMENFRVIRMQTCEGVEFEKSIESLDMDQLTEYYHAKLSNELDQLYEIEEAIKHDGQCTIYAEAFNDGLPASKRCIKAICNALKNDSFVILCADYESGRIDLTQCDF